MVDPARSEAQPEFQKPGLDVVELSSIRAGDNFNHTTAMYRRLA